MTAPSRQALPEAFIWKRLHSLTGIWISIFLIGHLLTNSQAALFIGDDGSGFIRAVNSIHDLPYLPVIEIAILAFPILLHMIWGIKFLRTAEYNSYKTSDTKPYLPYPRNKAYTWQRITSWILVVGIIAHVIHMRFIEYPHSLEKGLTPKYMVRVTQDEGLSSLAQRLEVKLYNEDQLQAEPKHLAEILAKRPLKPGEVVAVANNFGVAELLMVRDTFKIPYMLVLYTLLVLAACFHGFNGLWTFMITWGFSISQRAQTLMRRLSIFLMLTVGFLGLAAVWLTYWVNLKN